MVAQFSHKLGFINVCKIKEADTACNGAKWAFYAEGFYKSEQHYKNCYLWLYSDTSDFTNITHLEIEGIKNSLGEVNFITYPGNFLDKRFHQQLNNSINKFLIKAE